MKKILELYRQGKKSHVIARQLNIDKVLVDAVIKSFIEPIDKSEFDNCNIRVVVENSEGVGVKELLQQDGFKESIDYRESKILEQEIDLKNIKKILYNLRILNIKETRIIL
ncbi:MAG: hypothetical protein FIB08_03710 [Candidatus Methanoperedens sp.]|nr:hypothetical protein [Candidatus Methanoperedens sp.]